VAAVSRSNKHADHFTFSIVELPYRAGADDLALASRAQKQGALTVYGFRPIDVRQTRIDEVPYERVGVTIKMLMPNGLNEPSSLRRVAELEGPDLPIDCKT